eukprot:TRINITY_DN4682_c0_g2_i1.p1 TRINITY_DN4682_c0_g2~~TRINITY_DN4682_c0_g2_i1.p1  ORF type:complete len:279 (+),score=101.00 TRINITY_DN4682_c0_g2_i1:61-897(+)
MAMTSSVRRRPVLQLALALLGLRTLAPAFISAGFQATSTARSTAGRDSTALRAEEDKDGAAFLKTLKVEQDIELSPEEYKMALEQEIEAQRKKYYIGGVVKKQNLVVPWKPVDEVVLMKDAKKQLKKNGIRDPSGDDVEDEIEEDSEVDIVQIGEDIRLDWAGGAPGTKVGYIIERKREGQGNFQEIATYDNMKNPQLLVKQYAGHEYSFDDEEVAPGNYIYRVLCRYRSGEITVVDEKDILVAEAPGADIKFAGAAFLLVVVFTYVFGTSMDPGVQP